jgi:Ca-activated chloride channel family protein
VDGLAEARRVFVRELAGTLVTLARDVKLQVEWNPARVRAYRLIGYDNRRLANADFDDDTKDAGELGVGHAVTALYEIVPADAPRETASGRYVQVSLTDAARRGDELATVRLRYKTPTGGRSRLHSRPIPAVPATSPDADFRFALAVAEAALVLRQSEHRGSASLAHAAAAARASLGEDQDGERAAFAALMERAATFTVATEDRGARD